MTDTLVVCRVDEVAEGQGRAFIVGEGHSRRDILVVCSGGELYAYINSCPHQGTPLETFPDKFLSEDGSLLVCSTHGARFRVADGACISGPCLGKNLAPVAYEICDALIRVRI